MKVVRVRIQNYRSIVDSSPVDIEDGVTVLVGKNEQGKTTFLKGLESFNHNKKYSRKDLPNHLTPTLEARKPETVPVIKIWFRLEPDDHKALETILPEPSKIKLVVATKYYGNNYTYAVMAEDSTESALKLSPPDTKAAEISIRTTAEALKAKLLAHKDRLPEFAQNTDRINQTIDTFLKATLSDVAQLENIVGTFFTSLKGLPGQDQAIQADLADAQKAIDVSKAEISASAQRNSISTLISRFPTFVFHSSGLDQIPDEVVIDGFVANPDATSKGMANLCRAAGLTVQKIQELAKSEDRSVIQPYEDFYKGQISGGVNEFWRQESYVIHFLVERERLSVSISDNTYSPRVRPSDRSDGFRWYLSFYCRLLNDVGSTSPKCILLDNPAVDLHIDGQRDIKRFLEEKMALDCQIMYVTHSPAMIDAYNLAQVRKVELLTNNQGTKLSSALPKEEGNFDLLEPVRLAIGASLVGSLLFDEWNVLVEGAADKPVLDATFEKFKPDKDRRVLVNGSISESKDGFLARFYQRAGLPFAILLDGDDNGRRIKGELERTGIESEVIVLLSDIFHRDVDIAVEDIFSEDFYLKAVRFAYPDKKIDAPEPSKKKRANVYEEHFRTKFDIGFSKRRVADAAANMIRRSEGDDETLNNLKKLSEHLAKKLATNARSSSATMKKGR